MGTQIQNNTIKNILYTIAGLIGISFIILIHEAGHFVFAKFFNVSTPIFSLGFGPTLFSFSAWSTDFKLSLFPIGGYVEINPEELTQQPYIPKMLIFFGGILFNIIFAYTVLLYYTVRKKLFCTQTISSTQTIKETFADVFSKQNGSNAIVGPIGIINMIGKSLAVSAQFYWFCLAIISFNIALLNVIPLPFFDGGKALLCTIESLIGYTIPIHIVWFISAISIVFFALFMTQITMNDIKRLIKK